MQVDAEGWDPYYFPDGAQIPSDAVLLTYVLNVIEDPEERRATLLRAWYRPLRRWRRTGPSGAEWTEGRL